MSTGPIFNWLHQVCEEDRNSYVDSKKLFDKLVGKFGKVSVEYFGKCVHGAFPGVKKAGLRRKDNWQKRFKVFRGIKERVQHTSEFILSNIADYLPDDFFCTEKSNESVTASKFTKLICNGNKVYLEVTITCDGIVNASVGGTNINKLCGLSEIDMKTTSLHSLFALLNTVRLCKGVPLTNSRTFSEDKENVLIQKNADNTTVIYSITCQKVLSPTASKNTTTCRKCIHLTSPKASENEHTTASTSSVNAIFNPDPCQIPVPNTRDNTPQLNQNTSENTPHLSSTTTDNTQESNDDICPVSVSNPQLSPAQIMSIVKDNAPYLSKEQMQLIDTQLSNSCKTDAHARRWDNNTLSLAMSIWSRSPAAYRQLTGNGSLVLPSEKTLSRYKNSVEQKAGINNDMLKWMLMEAKHENIPPVGYKGGLILDEMAIQPDLQIIKRGGNTTLVGFPNLGPEGASLASSDKPTLANHVLQFMFNGLTGFRFLVAHYPTMQANGAQLYSVFWDVVKALEQFGFTIIYTCLDGASTNRAFIKMHFDGSPVAQHMSTTNPFGIYPVIFLADPSHLFKKIRNGVFKSGTEKWHTRLLRHDELDITWKLFLAAYNWDRKHGLSIHHKLTYEHLHPNKADLMRNHLAEDVLDDSMLHLMVQYKYHLGDDGGKVCGTISLLEQTSTLIRIFRDRRPIVDAGDTRVHDIMKALHWFMQWEDGSVAKQLLSAETREDIKFMIYGFRSLVNIVTTKLNHTVTPLFINSDIVENNFSQQRGLHHGAGSNPNYSQYAYATNSITMCQNIISKKANAARRKSTISVGSLPFKKLKQELNM